MFRISVIIATCKRNDLLLQRSLKSVYNQTYSENVDVVVCIDEKDSEMDSAVNKLRQQIELLRKREKIENFPTKVIPNRRTKFHSGTGAWNTAILSEIDLKSIEENDSHYIAILDDDDSWDSEYLESVAKNCPVKTGLVVSGIKYIEPNGKIQTVLATNLDEKEIFIKNPGVFGSNLFVNLNVFLSCGGFDESMKSTTDRDFLMRYTDFESNSDYNTVFCDFALVNHFADENRKRVTSDKIAKKQGLDLFYYKYQHLNKFEELRTQSLERAKKLFGYTGKNQQISKGNEIKILNHNLKVPNKITLVVGFICFELQNFERLIKSLNQLTLSPFLDKLIVYVLTNKEYGVVFSEKTSNYNFEIIIDCNRNGIDSIAQNRTLLRNQIYNHFKSKDFVTWIVDDDLELYDKDYVKQIAYYKNQNDTDLLFSLTTNEPPIPFFLTLRRNLFLYFFLKKNDKEQVKLEKQNFLSDFYYDLTDDFKLLEMFVSVNSTNTGDILDCLKNGQSAYTIDLYDEYFGTEIPRDKYSIVGGNCIILNKEYLLVPNYTPDRNIYNRRSDFNWSILCQKKGASIKRVYLPMKHIRETKFDIEKESRKFEKDLVGNRFYRIFYDIVIAEKSYECISEEYAEMTTDLKQRLYFNLMRVLYFTSLVSDNEIQKIGKFYEESVKKILKKEFSISKDLYLSIVKYSEEFKRNGC